MAIINCKECGTQISSKSKKCRHCGAPVGSSKKKAYFVANVVLWTLVILIAYTSNQDSGSSDRPSRSQQQQQVAAVDPEIKRQQAEERRKEREERRRQREAEEAACRLELQCAGDKYSRYAGSSCPPHIERLAKYQHKWTDEGWFEQKFTHFQWKDRMGGVITFLGDKLRFQNGFGAWQNMVYECDFNVNTEEPVAVRVSAGRL